jgi:hypothetical protein
VAGAAAQSAYEVAGAAAQSAYEVAGAAARAASRTEKKSMEAIVTLVKVVVTVIR